MSASQTWLVTGASRGIGLGIIQQLLRSPENIIFATCRDPSSAVALNALGTTPEIPGKLHVIQMDVTDEASISRATANIDSILGNAGLDYLINNAAIGVKDDTPSTLSPKDLTATMMSNVMGPALVTRTFTPLIERGNRKVIANITSSLSSHSTGSNFGGKYVSYSISKAALNMLVQRQAQERPDLIPFLVDPGWVKTDMGGKYAMLEPHQSAAGIINVMSNANQSSAGRFVNYKGETVPW